MGKQDDSTKEIFCSIRCRQTSPPVLLPLLFTQFRENTGGDINQIFQKQDAHRQNHKEQHSFPDHTANSGFDNRAHGLPSPSLDALYDKHSRSHPVKRRKTILEELCVIDVPAAAFTLFWKNRPERMTSALCASGRILYYPFDQPDTVCGCNHVSLTQARKNFAEFGACMENLKTCTRPPREDEKHGPD